MSIKSGDSNPEVLYIGLKKRTIPLEGESIPQGFVFTISKDEIEIYGAPILTLNAESTYQFVIDTPGYPFYITTSNVGGGVNLDPPQSLIGQIEIVPQTSGELSNVGIEKGVLTFTPSRDHTQMKLYYQSNFHPHAGNSLVVK